MIKLADLTGSDRDAAAATSGLLAANPKDRYGILRAFKDGGYSDDMILGAVCSKHGLRVGVPSVAILPQRLEKGMTWPKYLNYIYRQLYVLDTYVDGHNRRLNLILLAVHSFASLAVALATLSLLISPFMFGWNSLPINVKAPCYLYLAMVSFAQASLYYMTSQTLDLIHYLANQHQSTSKVARITLSRFNWFKIWLGLLIESVLVPFLALTALTSPFVTWGGIKYRKARGKVSRII